jgi:hypothetical protein
VTGIPIERLFSMGALDGLRLLILRGGSLGDVPLLERVALLRSVESDAVGLDFPAALALYQIVGDEVEAEEPEAFYRECIAAIILSRKQSWARAVIQGRDRLLSQLSRDEHQCFRIAGLLNTPPAEDVVDWWDGIAGKFRLASDQEKLEQGRAAEKLTLKYEREKLARLGIQREPRWIAVEDNTVGYDVLSYTGGGDEPLNQLIEVKSTVASPLRFYLTRNEWRQAERSGSAYVFHIWDVSRTPPRRYERTVDEIRPHVPSDQASGRWTVTEIPVIGT